MQVKSSLKKVLTLMLAASMALTACGTTSVPTENTPSDSSTAESTTPSTSTAPAESGKEITDLVLADVAGNELNTFNILNTQTAVMTAVLSNLTDGLLEVNPAGQLVPCLAETWGTEDGGKTWTFNLRDGVKWVDVNGNEKADCTAQDFLTGLEWVLNFHKNASLNTSMPIEMIEGASEYYEYTKELSAEEAYKLTADEGSKFAELVGIKAPDEKTVVYTCVAELPYFDSLAAYASLYPAPQALIDELGVDGFLAMDNQNMWYNGCYTVTHYVQGNEKVLTKNPAYWDTDCTLFDSVTIKMVDSNEIAYQMYENGEIDYVQLGEAQIKTITENPNHQFYDNIVADQPGARVNQIHWNFSKNNADGTVDETWNTVIANEAFRLSILYGLDLSGYFSRFNAVDPLSCESTAYTRTGFVYLSDGTDYADLVKEKLGIGDYNGETMVRLNQEKAEAYKKQAMEELSALGISFPVKIDYHIAANSQSALDNATVLKDAFSQSLGDDFVELNILTYVSSQFQEVRDPGVHGFAINGWGADYGDPQNLLGQETYGYDNAYFSQKWTRINLVEETEATKALLDTYKEFTALVEKANAITNDMDARYEAYAEAEVYLIQHGLTTPCYVDQPLCLTNIDISSKAFALYGGCNNKMKNWVTNSDGYTA